MSPEDEQRLQYLKDLEKQSFPSIAMERQILLKNELAELKRKAQQAQIELQSTQQKTTIVESDDDDDLDDVVKDYNKRYQEKDGNYPVGFKAPEITSTPEGKKSLRLSFADDKSAIEFFKEHAQKNLVITDENKKVIAYAKGGQLYHGDGKPCNTNDKLTSHDASLDDIKKDQQSNSAPKMN